MRYPPCCSTQILQPLGSGMMQCCTCGEVLPPYAPREALDRAFQEAPPPITADQHLRMLAELDQEAARLEEGRR